VIHERLTRPIPVLEVWVDLEELKDTSSEMIDGFNDRLMSWLPSMIIVEGSGRSVWRAKRAGGVSTATVQNVWSPVYVDALVLRDGVIRLAQFVITFAEAENR